MPDHDVEVQTRIGVNNSMKVSPLGLHRTQGKGKRKSKLMKVKKVIMLGGMLALAVTMTGCGDKKEETNKHEPFLTKSEAQAESCISNMKQLCMAGELWQERVNNTDKIPTLDDLCGPEDTKFVRRTPTCPSGGKYKIVKGKSGLEVTCSFSGHELP